MSEHLCVFCNQPGTTLKALSSKDGETWLWKHDSPQDCMRALQYRIDALSKEVDYWRGRYKQETLFTMEIERHEILQARDAETKVER
jgi:hypothetical protein